MFSLDTGTYFFLGLLIFFALVILTVTAKTGQFTKSLFLSALSGLGSLLAVNLLTGVTAVSIPLNPITVAVSSFFGISGVISLVVSQILV